MKYVLHKRLIQLLYQKYFGPINLLYAQVLMPIHSKPSLSFHLIL